jgi:hypothetical protein
MWIFEVLGTIMAIIFLLFMLVFLFASGLIVFVLLLGLPLALLLSL